MESILFDLVLKFTRIFFWVDMGFGGLGFGNLGLSEVEGLVLKVN